MRENFRLKKLKLILGAFLLLACLGAFWVRPAPAAAAFPDLADAAWAAQAIEELCACGVVAGYPDGSFNPYGPVSRLEAVAMLVRVLGLEGEAKARENAAVGYEMPADLKWGRGYLVLAVERGMLDKNYLHLLGPSEPASRVEVAALTCLALKLKSSSASLTFNDADQIPEGYRSYVAALVEQGIMQGLPGNVFMPNEGINRAQVAVLLARLLDKGLADPCPGRRFLGAITSIDAASGRLVLKMGVYGSLVKQAAAGCRVYAGGKQVSLKDIKSGDEVCLVLDERERIVFIKKTPIPIPKTQSESSPGPAAAQTHRGRVESLYYVSGEYRMSLLDFEGRRITCALLPSTPVAADEGGQDIYSLAAGDLVEAVLSGGQAVKVSYLKTEVYEGSIEDLTGEKITLRRSSGSQKEFKLAKNLLVEKDKSELDRGDLEEGLKVRVTSYGGQAVKIEVLDTGYVKGEIEELDTAGTYHITLGDDGGKTRTYTVSKKVKCRRDGKSVDFEDLEEGEYVRAELEDGEVTYIEVLEEDQSGKVKGVVTYLRTGTNPRIEVEKSSGKTARYNVARDAECERDGDEIGLSDIIVGSEVKLEVKDGEVVRIEVTNDDDITLEGEVVSVSASSGRIKIKQSSGNTFTFYVDKNARIVSRDGGEITLQDVRTGWDVELELEDGEVVRLTRK